MELTRLTVRLVRMAALMAVVPLGAALIMVAGDGGTVNASTRGELSAVPAHTKVGDLITVTVLDPDVETTVLSELEATDFTGNPYSLPPGAQGELTIFRVKNSPLADFDGDGDVDAGDIAVTIPTVSIAWVAPETGTFALLRGEANISAVSFTSSYRYSVADTIAVKVTSPSDPEGFELVLRESAAQSREFVGTFLTGEATAATNAADPGASPRPAIKASDGQLVNIEYADQSPLTLVTNSVLVDTTVPTVSVLVPANGYATRNVSEFARVRVTDGGSGVMLSDIQFHVDLDRDGQFDGVGETVVASESLSAPINQGWEGVALLPAVSTDGAVKWYATVTDRAGNAAKSDSDAGATGQQPHTFIVDTVPPRPEAAYLGSSYDEDDEKILTNVQKSIRVVFSEDLDPDSIDPKRFVVGAGNVAAEGMVHEDHPDTVWLTFDSLSSVVETMTVHPGAVKDAAGFPSEMFFIDPVDQLGPVLRVETDRAVTNGVLNVTATSEETLGSPPSLTINGVTYSKMVEVTPLTWTLAVDAATLAGAASGQGVKNVQVAGLDSAGNAARGGQSPDAATYPGEAVLFEFDAVIKPPTIVPGNGVVATSLSPMIIVTYAEEMGEYTGDTHDSVTIVSAKLDGFDVTPLMSAATSTSWVYQPSSLAEGEHSFTVQARDDAGNVHGAMIVRFSVDAPEPEPTPTRVPTPTPTVNVEDPGDEPPPALRPVVTPTATEADQPAEVATATATATVGPTQTAKPTPTPGGSTEGDIQATVTAIRSAETGDELDREPKLAADAGYTVFGCGLPMGNAASAVGDYAVVGIGLLGLIVFRERNRRALRIAEDQAGTRESAGPTSGS